MRTFAPPAPGAGSGDVTGPGSSTDQRIVRFNGATGKIIEESPVTIGDLSSGQVVLDCIDAAAVMFRFRNTGAGNVSLRCDGNITGTTLMGNTGVNTPLLQDLYGSLEIDAYKVTGDSTLDIKNSVGGNVCNTTMDGTLDVSGAVTVGGYMYGPTFWLFHSNTEPILLLWANGGVDYVAYRNGTGAAYITAGGTSSDVDVSLKGKGTGKVKADNDGTYRQVATLDGTETLSSKTLTTPTIADFTNATHNHSNAAGGGSTLTSPQINTPTINDGIIEDTIGFDTVETISSFTGSKTLDWNTGQAQQATMAGNVTSLTFTDPPKAGWYYLWITQATGTHYDITWSSVNGWAKQETPVVTQADAALDLFAFWYTGSGSTYWGIPVKNFG